MTAGKPRGRTLLQIATGAGGPARRRPRHEESEQQRAFVKRVRMDARTKGLLFCAIPNGGRRGKVEAAIMKGEGVTAGAPDLVFFERGASIADHAGLWLEFKTADGDVSPAQMEWHRKLAARGWSGAVVRSHAEAWTALLTYMGIPE